MTNRFAALERISRCEHKNLYPNYSVSIPCGTPYCSGEETHCRDCGGYISDCGCHYNTGISGWPQKRHRAGAVG